MTPSTRTRPRPPVRLVHLGLGAFHRAHQVWFTERADPDWGIAAFTGRTSGAADALTAQDTVYTLVERSARADELRLMESIVEARPGDDVPRLCELTARPEVAAITLTVTEAGYHLADGRLDIDSPAVQADIDALRTGSRPRTAPGRLLAALDARRRANLSGVAVVPCDNLRANGRTLRAIMEELSQAVDTGLGDWIGAEVAFVDTVVDRITPPASPEDRDTSAGGPGSPTAVRC